ncbi:MAG: class I SAM-dependent methyltransferase [Planctomycetes bacterium]|nr:class I SAM-dependent methyltransferase [Planctomycetota bacterium]
MDDHPREISDLIVAYDPATLARLPVRKAEVVDYFRQRGNVRAATIADALPAHDGVLDNDAMDRLLIEVHCEMQLLSEEFNHGRRMRELLAPFLNALRAAGAARPLRVVDIGCGGGFVMRWLGLHGDLGDDVELIGADYNAALVGRARELAAAEGSRCRFEVANAFTLAQPGSVYVSTGVIHHFRGDELRGFFASHAGDATQVFLHTDFQPSPLAPFGAWLFHKVRMRIPLSHHDGCLSAARAHSAQTLTAAATTALPGFTCAMFGRWFIRKPLPRVFHTLVGFRPALREHVLKALGSRAGRLEL